MRAKEAFAIAVLGIFVEGPVVAQSALGHAGVPWQSWSASGTSDRYFLLEVASGVQLNVGHDSIAFTRTGVREIDALNRIFHVVNVERVHRDPPRGHANPAAFRALGLDRMYYCVFAQPRLDFKQVAARYGRLTSVERAWTDSRVDAAKVPNDTDWGNQWNLSSSSDLNCPPGWDHTTTATVLVSVIDTGGDLDHSDLGANIWVNPGEIPNNGKDDDGNGYVDDVNGWDFFNNDSVPDDDNGHGSHVSGILGAIGDNSTDVAGICWSVSIQQVKVLNFAGNANSWTPVSQGIVYAADNGSRVSNYSLGGSSDDPGLDAAIAYAASLDVVQVAAAGNFGSSAPFYPAALPNVISVMATDASQNRTSWSDYGSWCDLCAPGDAIFSLWKNNGTNTVSGTSMSSPHVAGIAALSRTVNPMLDALDTELVIEYSAKDLGTAGNDSTYAWGLADCNRAMLQAPSLTVSTTSAKTGDKVTLSVARPDLPSGLYVIIPSISGRLPGEYLGNDFPNETRYLPVNPDYVSFVAFAFPNVGIFDSFVGVLDANGNAAATFNIPRGRMFQGQRVDFSGIFVDAADLSAVAEVMNSVGVEVQ